MGVSPVLFESKSTRDFFQVGSMSRRAPWLVLFALLLLFTAACTNKKVSNPLANVGSKQPDKVLFDRAMDAMKHNRFDVARMTLQTLINTYPDSEYIARAKLAVADSWFAEGGTAALTQAEIEYKDFDPAFPFADNECSQSSAGLRQPPAYWGIGSRSPFIQFRPGLTPQYHLRHTTSQPPPAWHGRCTQSQDRC